MKLYVEESFWSSEANDKSESKKSEYELKKDVKNVVKVTHVGYNNEEGNYVQEDREDFSFVITEIENDFITIETNRPMSDGTEKTIDALSQQTTFKIEKGEKVNLTTLTKDAGNIYTFELI